MRMLSIDMLRGIAVILVLFRHFGVIDILGKIGWSGVDLFFVLSGFLVSGLLFKEYKQTTTVNASRFLIRRGFKIYPAFYIFITFTVIKAILVSSLGIEGNKNFTLPRLFAEIFFVQNHFERLWAHTWSLAVEEHFYILCILIVMFLASRKKLDDSRVFTALFIVIACCCFCLRILNFFSVPFSLDTHLYYTHLRVDALFFGVFLAHNYHFRKETMDRFINANRLWLVIAAAMCLSFMFLLELDSFFMYTIGLTLTYIGYGIVIVLCVQLERLLVSQNRVIRSLVRPLAYVGLHSYSVYLWHLAVLAYIAEPFFKTIDNNLAFGAYFFGSIFVGISISKLIERPMLKLRDSKFPVLTRYHVS